MDIVVEDAPHDGCFVLEDLQMRGSFADTGDAPVTGEARWCQGRKKLEGIGAANEKPLADAKSRDRGLEAAPALTGKERQMAEKDRDDGPEKVPEPRQRSVEMDFGLYWSVRLRSGSGPEGRVAANPR